MTSLTECKTIEIDCEYSQGNSDVCTNGQLFIYGDFPTPGHHITCPQCQGKGKIAVPRGYIQRMLEEAVEERDELEEKILLLSHLLKGN